MTGQPRKRVRTFGHIRRRSNGKWQALYTVDGETISAGVFHSKGEADAKLGRLRADLLDGLWTDPALGQIALRTYADAWLDNHVELRPRSRDVYRSLLDRHVLPTFGRRPLDSVSPEAVRAWYAATSRRYPSTAKAAYRLLRAIYNTAIEDGRLIRNPCRVKGAGTDKAEERRVPTSAEVGKLVLALPERLRAMAVLAAGAGLRRGEVLGLRRGDVDLDRRVVHVRGALCVNLQ